MSNPKCQSWSNVRVLRTGTFALVLKPDLTAQGVLGHLERLVVMLEEGVGGAVAQETPFGMLAPPLGTARLKAVEVVAALLRMGSPSAEQGMCIRPNPTLPYPNPTLLILVRVSLLPILFTW